MPTLWCMCASKRVLSAAKGAMEGGAVVRALGSWLQRWRQPGGVRMGQEGGGGVRTAGGWWRGVSAVLSRRVRKAGVRSMPPNCQSP